MGSMESVLATVGAFARVMAYLVPTVVAVVALFGGGRGRAWLMAGAVGAGAAIFLNLGAALVSALQADRFPDFALPVWRLGLAWGVMVCHLVLVSVVLLGLAKMLFAGQRSFLQRLGLLVTVNVALNAAELVRWEVVAWSLEHLKLLLPFLYIPLGILPTGVLTWHPGNAIPVMGTLWLAVVAAVVMAMVVRQAHSGTLAERTTE